MADRWTLHEGDCLEVLRSLPADSIDALVCDPPYGLGAAPDLMEVLPRWLAGERYEPKGRGFMGKAWDAFVPGPEVWREVFRVLKPGAHAAVFAGTRTFDLMGVALRLAGFELRDSIGAPNGGSLAAWVYGSGFPKSLDVSKAIDAAAGAEREVVGPYQDPETGRGRVVSYKGQMGREYQAAIGYRPAGEPYACEALDGTPRLRTAPATEAAKQWEGWGTALKPAWEPILLVRKPLAGTVAANVLAHGAGALNIDACRVALPEGDAPAGSGNRASWRSAEGRSDIPEAPGNVTPSAGRWPPNLLLSCCGSEPHLDGCPVRELDAQSGERVSGSRAAGVRKGLGYHGAEGDGGPAIEGSAGGASRFFPVFRYQPKASRSEREQGCEALPRSLARNNVTTHNGTGDFRSIDKKPLPRVSNTHPTVKPRALMAWLCRLITPPGGTVLDPFAGSGSTGVAALLEGFRFIGCEREPEYAQIARARLAWASPSTPSAPTQAEQLSLFF
jgi:DNA modification methylase